MIPADKIKKVYSLRWHIELTFKVWKSQAKINKVKEMKIHRFECHLIAKMIWLLAHMKIDEFITQLIHEQWPSKTLSIWKYYKHAYRINYLIRKIISKPKKLIMLLQDLVAFAQDMFLLEKKKGKCYHYEVFMNLT